MTTTPTWQPTPDLDPKAAAKAAKAYAKASRPFYKKKRVILPAALVAVVAISTSGGGSDTADTAAPAANSAAAPADPAAPAPAPAEAAIVVSSKEMIDLLEGNALNAKNTYEGKQVTVSGFVGNIDASGDYFSLDPEPDAFILTGIQVQTSDDFAGQVASFSKGQAVTVTGTITNVGELMGYSLEAQTIG